jgi:hypothetical protein
MKRNFKSCPAINYAYKTNIFIVEKEIKMFFLFYWSFFIVCCFADKINLNEKHEISLDIGLYPQTSLNFFVSIDSTIRLQTNRNISLISKTSTTLFDTGQHDYITVANYPPIFTTIAHILEEPNLVSLGWLSAYMGCDVSIFENILYYCTVPKQFSRYKTSTVLDMSHCYTNEIIKTPDTILHQNNLNICLDEILDIIKIPQSLMLIDRTKKECISFKNIFRQTYCSDDITNGEFTLHNHDENFITLGINKSREFLGITQHFGSQTISSGWNENPVYSLDDITIILIIFFIYAAWSLSLNAKFNSPQPKVNFSQQRTLQFKTILLLMFSLILITNIVYQVLEKELVFRMQYVHASEITENSKVYVMFSLILIIITSILHLFSIKKDKFVLFQGTFETLLAASLLSIFIGRTRISEESVIAFIIAFVWIFSQLKIVAKLYLYGIIYLALIPFVVMFSVEPFAREFPFVENYSYTTSALLLFIPFTIVTGYAMYPPKKL